MEFKIDTKENFSVITPIEAAIDEKMAQLLGETIENLRQKGSSCFIVDCMNCTSVETKAIDLLIDLNDTIYASDGSLVFTQVHAGIVNKMKDEEKDLQLNIAPQLQEAIDIIMMEKLERDLMNEEG
jgi:anti-anti-sigma regulatory factor